VEDSWSEISEKAERHPYWINRAKGDDELAKRRAAFCTLFSSDVNVSQISSNGVWFNIKNRICSLLDILEKSGLFVLRQGSIESYYNTSDKIASLGKPSAAADEIESINQLEMAEIEKLYADIFR
jgi:hypothetical protein